MSGLCFDTGWSEEYAYNLDMIKIYDILYRDYEYFPETEEDVKINSEAKRKSIEQSLKQLRNE